MIDAEKLEAKKDKIKDGCRLFMSLEYRGHNACGEMTAEGIKRCGIEVFQKMIDCMAEHIARDMMWRGD
jgi:hypothetical protein